jgi:hypothetical protein
MESQSLDNMMNNYIQKKAAEGDPTFRAPSQGFKTWAGKQQMPEEFYIQAKNNGLDPSEEWAKVLEQTNRGGINQFMNDQGNRDMATMGAGAALGGGLGYLVGGDAASALMGTALGGLVGWVAKTFFNADINVGYEKVMAMHNNGTLQSTLKKWQANSSDSAIQAIKYKEIDADITKSAAQAGDATFESLAKKGEILPHDPNAQEEKVSEEVNSEPLPKKVQEEAPINTTNNPFDQPNLDVEDTPQATSKVVPTSMETVAPKSEGTGSSKDIQGTTKAQPSPTHNTPPAVQPLNPEIKPTNWFENL